MAIVCNLGTTKSPFCCPGMGLEIQWSTFLLHTTDS